MKANQFRSIAKTMQEFNITHVKMGDLEIIRPAVSVEAGTIAPQVGSKIPLDAPVEEPNVIEHKVEQLTSLLKMADTDLVDSLFPDHTEEYQEGA